MCAYVIKGEQRFLTQVELFDVVSGSMVHREVVTLNGGSDDTFLS